MHLGICTGSSYRMPANHPPIPGSYCGWDRKVSKYSIYIYIHIYTVDIYSIFMYIIILFFCFYIYILCINIYFLYIYTYKNIITYIDSYRSASKTLSLGFQVRKKVVFFSWAIWWRHASSGVKILQRLVTVLPLERVPDSVLVWKTFRSYWLIYSSKLFELFSLVNYYN